MTVETRAFEPNVLATPSVAIFHCPRCRPASGKVPFRAVPQEPLLGQRYGRPRAG